MPDTFWWFTSDLLVIYQWPSGDLPNTFWRITSDLLVTVPWTTTSDLLVDYLWPSGGLLPSALALSALGPWRPGRPPAHRPRYIIGISIIIFNINNIIIITTINNTSVGLAHLHFAYGGGVEEWGWIYFRVSVFIKHPHSRSPLILLPHPLAKTRIRHAVHSKMGWGGQICQSYLGPEPKRTEPWPIPTRPWSDRSRR